MRKVTTRNKKMGMRNGVLGVNVTPMAIGIFFIIATIIMVPATNYFSNMIKSNKISLAIEEAVNLYQAAINYSATATTNGYGFKGISGHTIVPYLSTTMIEGDDTLLEDASYLCSSTSFGCQIKYYLAEDDATNGTFHMFIDASLAIKDKQDLLKYETSIDKSFSRATKRQAVIDAGATSISATGSTPGSNPFTGEADTSDGIFEISNLN